MFCYHSIQKAWRGSREERIDAVPMTNFGMLLSTINDDRQLYQELRTSCYLQWVGWVRVISSQCPRWLLQHNDSDEHRKIKHNSYKKQTDFFSIYTHVYLL